MGIFKVWPTKESKKVSKMWKELSFHFNFPRIKTLYFLLLTAVVDGRIRLLTFMMLLYGGRMPCDIN